MENRPILSEGEGCFEIPAPSSEADSLHVVGGALPVSQPQQYLFYYSEWNDLTELVKDFLAIIEGSVRNLHPNH